MAHQLLLCTIVLRNRGDEPGVTDVLILEDSDENRSFLRMLFEGEGYGVATAANGADALKWLNHHPAPSVIVLDLNMPVMNGWDFCAAVQARAQLAQIPLIVLSAEADAGAVARSLPARCTYIAKPALPDVLVQAIANHIQAGDRAKPQFRRM